MNTLVKKEARWREWGKQGSVKKMQNMTENIGVQMKRFALDDAPEI